MTKVGTSLDLTNELDQTNELNKQFLEVFIPYNQARVCKELAHENASSLD